MVSSLFIQAPPNLKTKSGKLEPASARSICNRFQEPAKKKKKKKQKTGKADIGHPHAGIGDVGVLQYDCVSGRLYFGAESKGGEQYEALEQTQWGHTHLLSTPDFGV